MTSINTRRRRQSGNLIIPIFVIIGVALALILLLTMVVPYGEDADSSVKVSPVPDKGNQVSAVPEPEPPSRVAPVAPAPASAPIATHEPTPPPMPVKPSPVVYVLDAQWGRYHQPSCQSIESIDPAYRSQTVSASQAVKAGYVPCKVCKPPTTDAPGVAAGAARVRPVSGPLPFTAEPVDFAYKVVERDPDESGDVVRVDYTVEVESILTPAQADALAKLMVAEEVKKGGVNAISIVIQRKQNLEGRKWIIWIDWAPFGSVTKAGVSATGDYRYHQFSTVLEGAKGR